MHEKNQQFERDYGEEIFAFNNGTAWKVKP